MQNGVKRNPTIPTFLLKGMEKNGTRCKRVLTVIFPKDKKEYPASTTSTTFAFLWKQGKRRMLRVPLFDERNGQKLFFRGTSGTCSKKNV